nr:immunoglobulin light chain junction region [Macaca mulatta]MOW17389.1 immunoglobulin light chain junction region [Macaca mulatta]
DYYCSTWDNSLSSRMF